MSTGIKVAAHYFIAVVFGAIYAVLKLVTRVDPCKITFLSRHSDGITRDFRMLIQELERRDPNIVIATVSSRFEGNPRAALRFGFASLRSLYHLATTKVCVLDSYWPAVSSLRHRPELVVFQAWHSLGKIKQSGRQTLDREQGRSQKLAHSMRIHEGYDWVIAGGKAWNPFYCASFGVDESKLLNIGLPRADYLVNHRQQIARRVLKSHPELAQKPAILYAPTFRRGSGPDTGARDLAAAIDRDRFTLIVHGHKDGNLLMPDGEYVTCPGFTGPELLTVAEYLVTDYSAIAVEAALIDVKTLYYVHDHDEYLATNGLNIDLFEEMPGCVSESAEEIARVIDGEYPMDALRAYQAKFIFDSPGRSTENLVDCFFEKGGLCTR